MPNLIDKSFFVRQDLSLPNLNSQTSSADATALTTFINKYEKQCLLKTLGYPLWKAFENESSQRMTDLLDGAEYTDGNGDLQLWPGLVHDDDISFIANYIYFYKQEVEKAQTAGSGTLIVKPVAGENLSPADKMAFAWNFFSEEVYKMTCFLWLKKIGSDRVYSEFSYHQFLETRRISRKIDSVFQF